MGEVDKQIHKKKELKSIGERDRKRDTEQKETFLGPP